MRDWLGIIAQGFLFFQTMLPAVANSSDFDVVQRQWSEILRKSSLLPPQACSSSSQEQLAVIECDDLNAFQVQSSKSALPFSRQDAAAEFSDILKDLRAQVATWEEGPAKSAVSTRINSDKIRLDDSACSTETDRDDMNASYSEESQAFTLCEGVLRKGSRILLVRTLAHEFGHLVFRALFKEGTRNFFPPDLIACLRSSDGANARRDEEVKRRFETWGKVSEPSRGLLAGFHNELYHDQLEEVFADYFATEYMATVSVAGFSPKDYANAYAESVPATLIDSDPQGWARLEKESAYPFWLAHPRRVDRLNRIVMVHPGIRRRMGCPDIVAESGRYCGSFSSHL